MIEPKVNVAGFMGEKASPAVSPIEAYYPAAVQGAVVAVFLPAILGFSLWPLVREPRIGQGEYASKQVSAPLRLDLNRATRVELAQVPGIGPITAGKIVEFRDQVGPFSSLNDLDQVKGIGKALVNRVQRSLYVNSENIPTRTLFKEKLGGSLVVKKIDPNLATQEQLMELPGIGRVLAARIVQSRGQVQFEKAEDMKKVLGIGNKTLEKLQPFLEFPSNQVK
ncbi:MAG: helix-hairpin-helix domain-containing protein [Gemmataceae bacterium]|nr:helix-hairpin-helix domain-containing protein [Gemmataceae bacterium]